MNKKIKYATNGAIIFGIGNAFLNFINQMERMNENPQLKFDWKELLIAGGKGALVGGAGGLALGAIVDYQNSLENPMNTDGFLAAMAKDLKLDKENGTYRKLSEKADWLTSKIKVRFNNELGNEPIRTGSTETGTALDGKFDIDICLPFSSSSFSSTEEMYFELKEFFEKLIGTNSIVRIRDQKKSLGIVFELRGKEYKIDIVPYKITEGSKTSGYLYLNDSSFFGKGPSYTKTDIHALKSIKLSETQKKIVVILKHWKEKENLPLSSHLLQHLVLDSYAVNRNRIPKGLTKKIIMVLNYISNNLDSINLRSIENTNNILTDISTDKKLQIINSCKSAIEEYEYQPNSIVGLVE